MGERRVARLHAHLVSASSAATAEDVILYEVLAGNVALITLNRPTRLNSLTNESQALYFDLLERAEADPAIRVIVVTGKGRGFCAGAEMDLLKTIGSDDKGSNGGPGSATDKPRRSLKQIQALGISKPIIAAVNGPTAGIGFVLAMMSDVRFATEGAKFTTAFAKRGLVAEHGISHILPRICGVSNAMDILLSSRVFLGTEAKELGIVSKTFPDQDALMAHTLAYAREMARLCSPASMAAMKSQVYEHLDKPSGESFKESALLMKKSFGHPDSKEGVTSYVEKRDPKFQGLAFGKIHNVKLENDSVDSFI